MPAILHCNITNTVELFQVTLEWPPPGNKDNWLLYSWRKNQRWIGNYLWYSADASGWCRRQRKRNRDCLGTLPSMPGLPRGAPVTPFTEVTCERPLLTEIPQL